MEGYTVGPDDDLDEAASGPAATHAGPDAEPPTAAPVPPTTDDAQIDAVLRELADAQQGSLGERIEAGERTHQALRDRLSDLGGQ